MFSKDSYYRNIFCVPCCLTTNYGVFFGEVLISQRFLQNPTDTPPLQKPKKRDKGVSVAKAWDVFIKNHPSKNYHQSQLWGPHFSFLSFQKHVLLPISIYLRLNFRKKSHVFIKNQTFDNY